MGQSPVCCLQNEHGAYEPILPVPELERMYQRILAQELVVNEPQLASASAAGGARPRRPSRLQGRGLAAAVGMTQMTLPFRSACPPVLMCRAYFKRMARVGQENPL